MLTGRQAHGGYTLIELMVTLSILSFLMAMAAPSFATWMQNSRIRTSAESVLGGLQLAKGEAVSRNNRVRFQLTSTAGNDCKASTSGTNWVVNVDGSNNPSAVEGLCASAPDDTVSPFILQIYPAADGAQNVVNTASQSSIVFNGLGRPTPTQAGDFTINFSATTPFGTCAAAGGKLTCLRIVVSSQGQIRMCNPNITVAGDPRTC